MPRPLDPASRRRLTHWSVALLVAAALATSCARTLPMAPEGPASAARSGDSVAGQAVITVVPGTDVATLARDFGATVVKSESYGTATLQAPEGESAETLARRLAVDPRVASSEVNAVFETGEVRQQSFGFDDGFGSADAAAGQPAMLTAGFRAAHEVSRGYGVTIAILDTGIDPNHPLFAGRIAGGWDFVDNDADPTDSGPGPAWGHGTHVAGIAALAAPDARLLVVRVLDDNGRGDMGSVAAGIHWAVANGARVINLSLGSLSYSEAVHEALERAEQSRVVVFASAGNRGSDEPEEYPARSEEAVAVAAADGRGHAAPFTSYGEFVALTAPGVNVRSAYPGGRWFLWSGTSMSTPFVAGAAALLLSVHPGWGQTEVARRLVDTAAPVEPATVAMAGKLGAGTLDAAAALAPDVPAGTEELAQGGR